MNKKIYLSTMVVLALITMSGCGQSTLQTQQNTIGTTGQESPITQESSASSKSDTESAGVIDLASYDIERSNDSVNIIFSDNGVSASQEDGVEISGTDVVITQGGEYVLSGSAQEGSVHVAVPDDADVQLVFDGLDLRSAISTPIWIESGDEITILLAEGTDNMIRDDRSSASGQESDFAAVLSQSDLAIVGAAQATLDIAGYADDGVVGKDDVLLSDLVLSVHATDDGIRGKDLLEVSGATVFVEAGGDALTSDNEEDEGRGNIIVHSGVIDITAGDDAMHATSKIDVAGGQIMIRDSYEGMEARNIVIRDGEISIVSQDDGINIADSTATNSGGRGGKGVLADAQVSILGGTITINAGGDGFDSNGTAMMSGGTLIVHGPTSDGNGSIDVNGSFEISGGTLIAMGSAGMAEHPDESSAQRSVQWFPETTLTAGQEIMLVQGNRTLFEQTIQKATQSVTVSLPTLTLEESYDWYVDGALVNTVVLTDTVTIVGTRPSRGFGGGMGNRPERMMGEMPQEGMVPPNAPEDWDELSETERQAFFQEMRQTRPE